MLSTLDLVPIINHSTALDSKLGGMFTHRWRGPEWGEGGRILDPKRSIDVGGREWSDLALVTDAFGERRLHTLDAHVADGVAKNVLQVPEAKPQPKLTKPEFWENFAEVMDRHRHPLLMMTLTTYGDWLGRCKAAKTVDTLVALLTRGERPANFDTEARPYVDAFWGTAWGTL